MSKAGRRAAVAPAPQPAPAPPPAPTSRLALAIAALVAAASVVYSVSFAIFDPDLFQHLLVGKVIWQTHGVPQQHLWTWPSFGLREVLPSWLFRALAWPFWSAGGIWGLYAWRWLTTLLAFGLVWAVARRLGARGLAPLVAIALCALTYRQRSQVRPETLVAVLLALELWILETRRHGGPDRSWWLIVVAWAWANAHISYYLGLVVLGLFWAEEWRRGGRASPLGRVLLASMAISFVNPFGWRALAQPFEYFLYWRHEPIFQIVGELQPIKWGPNLRNGLPLLMAGWPALFLWRWRRGRLDVIEAAIGLAFTALVLFGQRFLGLYVLVAAPYLGRSLGEWLGRFRLVQRMPVAMRAGLACLACVTVGIPEWTMPGFPTGLRFEPLWYPEKACDFMAAHGVRGRGFNHFELAGYQLYRFWPERARLPFMDIHQTGTLRDRNDYAALLSTPAAWPVLDRRHHFDYALLSRKHVRGNASLEALDADSAFALVFVDDVAALYVRRAGPLAPVAEREAFRLLPAGTSGIAALQRRCATDSVACAEVAAELERAAASSPRNAQALSLLANVAMGQSRYAAAREMLARALAVNPGLARAHLRLGMMDLVEGRPGEALREFQSERRWGGSSPGLDLRIGQAYRRLGDRAAAERHYRRELERDAGNQEAADSLAALSRP